MVILLYVIHMGEEEWGGDGWSVQSAPLSVPASFT